jgi:hypothetical protein
MLDPVLTTSASTSYRDRLNRLIGATPLTGRPVLDVGQAGQIRAGRDLTAADFTTLLGISAPAGLFNLGGLANLGTGNPLVNKGGVTFRPGIGGAPASAAAFAGTAQLNQALYVHDTGAGDDPFRIRTGSFGCWMRTTKRGTFQNLVTKLGGLGNYSYRLLVGNGDTLWATACINGAALPDVSGTTDICDDRWHFTVATFDGSLLRIYVDAALDATLPVSGSIFPGSGPLNLGAAGADDGTSSSVSTPHFGAIDEAFVTRDVLDEDQIRLLYMTKIPHASPSTPVGAQLGVTRRRAGGALTTGDFPSPPVRLYGFGGSVVTGTAFSSPIADAGTAATGLTVAAGGVATAPGADGAAGGGAELAGTHSGLTSADTGLPAALAARSYGLWVKGLPRTADVGLISWGQASANCDLRADATTGRVRSVTVGDALPGPVVLDGTWHHLVVVEDNAAADGMKRKLYVDGRAVATSTTMASVTLPGGGSFRIGALAAAGSMFWGRLDEAFVCSVALSAEQVRALFQKAGATLAASPKDPNEHVEAADASSVYATFDALAPQDLVDLAVTA